MGDGNGFPSHDGSLKVCIGIVLVSIMLILKVGFFGSKFLKPLLIVVV